MASAARAAVASVYGVGANELYQITDFSTWATQAVGPTGTVTLTDIALNAAGTSLYGVDLFGAGFHGSELYSVSLTNGAISKIGATNVAGLNGLVLSAGGILYASDDFTGKIYTINTSTGAATLLGTNSGLTSEGDLEFDNGTLYLTGLSGGHDYLYAVSTVNGAATQVNPGSGLCTGLSNTGTCYTGVYGLALVNGIMEGFTNPNGGQALVLDINTTTGLVTATHPYAPGFNGVTTGPVPEPGVLSTTLLGLMAGAFALRKRRASKRLESNKA